MAYLDTLLPYTVEKTGLVMDTCRDCNHAEYNLLGMMAAAEIAWHQGIDFYGRKLDGQDLPRLLMGLEFHAAAFLGKPLNVGQSCGPRNCSGEDKHAGGWEMAENHYHNRMGLPAPATTTFVTTQNRPDGLSEDHFTGWTSLTHAELGNIASAIDPGIRIMPWAQGGARMVMPMERGGWTVDYRTNGNAVSPMPARLEMFSNSGRLLYATPLADRDGSLRIPEAAVMASGAGPVLLRIVPAGSAACRLITGR
jgi:hypothetical protein